ncbi:endonuclease/exonuclease/phosphatase family protein [Serratia fonticola]|uniref:endonuclease/exonuclease/phosphatase family protein n=1 Tax=Serratia fonticola TaxID=47917 RepID=UPI0015C6919E|nr:endonuclease/exonuclease/phosphatase family protein [Serratia fonticola]NXZ86278.1 endonuclease/exonuclease/phosphatase family protein [Serratia fonticola]
MKNIGKITLCWWNTSLSPHSQENKATDEHKAYVLLTLSRLLYEKSVDVMCLCEVSPEDILFISEVITGADYKIYNGAVRDGRKKFDLCVIYRSSILEFTEASIVRKPYFNGYMHAAQKVHFSILETNEPLVLFLVHWSSRLHDYEDSPKKSELGMLLRQAIDDCSDVLKIKKIIVIGDFNEEPFNKSITDHLHASRDIVLVKKQPKLLYNPFWRHLVYSQLHPNTESSKSHGGTYYYKNDQVSKWKTFDQMMFSSDFINGSSWFLNEKETIVYSDEGFINYVNSSKSKFDHLPIISVIERVNHE